MIISDLNYVKSTKQTVLGGVASFAGAASGTAIVAGTRFGFGSTSSGTAGNASATVFALPIFGTTSVSVGANATASGAFGGIGGLQLQSVAQVAGTL